jgi:pyruvate formate lyase activating enzyme
MHFSAFHPDFKLTHAPPTPARVLSRARRIALDNGVRYAYTGNVHDRDGDTTLCHGCGGRLIERDWYVLTDWRLTADGCCPDCGTACAGVFAAEPGRWGSRRLPVRLAEFQGS